MSDDELVGLSEVADLLGTSRQAVANWRQKRQGGFPEPIAKLKSGPIWRRTDIVDWAAANGKAIIEATSDNGAAKPGRRGTTVGLINMKGAVGNATLPYN